MRSLKTSVASEHTCQWKTDALETDSGAAAASAGAATTCPDCDGPTFHLIGYLEFKLELCKVCLILGQVKIL